MLFISLAFFAGCSDSQLAGTSEQRDLGHAVLDRGLEFRLSPGTITVASETSVEARASAPLPNFSVTTGPEAAPLSVTISNIHRQASVRVQQIRPLTATEMPGCPDTADAETTVCSESPDAAGCQPPATMDESDRLAQVQLELSQAACRRISYSLDLSSDSTGEASDEPLRFAIIGKTSSLDQLRQALDQATADNPDLVVLLGDNAQNASLNGLRELELVLRRADYPTVMLPGEDEIVEGSRTQFLRTFGPFDFRFGLKDVHLVAFFSAEAELGQDGVERLQSTLSRLSRERPKLLFTHTPPIDPNGLRDEGFESQIEGARTLSVLAEAGVEALFAGHINDAHSDEVNGVETHLTSVERASEYLWVEVDAGDVSVERRGL
jgi:hypothetical protein